MTKNNYRINNIKKIRLNLRAKTLFVLACLLFSGFSFLSFRWINFREENVQMPVIGEKKADIEKEKVGVKLKYEKNVPVGEEFVLGIKMEEKDLEIEALELELEIDEKNMEYLGIEESEGMVVVKESDGDFSFEEEKSYVLAKIEENGKLRIAIFNLRQKELNGEKEEILNIRFRKKSETEARIFLIGSERNRILLRENGELKKIEEIQFISDCKDKDCDSIN